MINNNDLGVIQFVSPAQKTGIEEELYKPKNEWNPSGKIQLMTIEDISQLGQKGLIFKKLPNLEEVGLSTFIQNPINPCEYIPIKDYGDYIKNQKEEIMVQILANLGIRQYYVRSECYLDAGFKTGNDKQTEAKGGFYAEAGADSSYTSSNGLKISFSKRKSRQMEFSSAYIPTLEKWYESVELANKCNLYDELSSIINTRKPGENNPSLLMNKKEFNIDGDFSFGFNIASNLKVFAGFRSFSAMGSFLQALDFDVFAHVHYKTLVIYNFSKEEYSEYTEAIKSEKEENKMEENN